MDNFIENTKNKIAFKIINVTTFLFSFICLFFHILIFLIHKRQPFFHSGYFKIVFIQSILYLGFLITLMAISLINILDIKLPKGCVALTGLFNFFYMTIISYNINTLIHLLINKNKSDEFIEDEDNNKSEERPSLLISIKKYSFIKIQVISILMGVIHTIFFVFITLQGMKKYELTKLNINFIFYFLDINHKNFKDLPVFIIIFVSFIISIPYLILCINNKEITEQIRLKYYSFHCFMEGLIGLSFPIGSIFLKYFNKKDRLYTLWILVTSILFIIYLFSLTYYRVSCYYIQQILSLQGGSYLNKFKMALEIIFLCRSVPTPNIVDYNSNYIIHSLSHMADFLTDIQIKNSMSKINSGLISDREKDSEFGELQ